MSIGERWSAVKELIFCHLLLAVTFVTTGLVVDFIQAFLFCTIKPWSVHLFRKLNYYATYTLNSQIVFLVEWWAGSTVTLYADPAEVEKYFGKEHGWLLLNHCYETDWLVGWVICDKAKILGNSKVYAKKVLQWAPVLGWSWKLQEAIFLERNWEKDRISLGTQLARLGEYREPFWLVMYPEGTRFTKKKHEASMEVARQKGLPELKHHLLPRTRGFVASVPHLKKGNVPAIYDVTVAFRKDEKYEPTVFSLLNGKPLKCCLLMRRIPLEQVPNDPVEAAAWLQKLYQHKDKVLDNFIETGEFDPNNEMEEYKKFAYINQPRRYYPLINICCWAAVILLPLIYYFYTMLTSGCYTSIAWAFVLVLAAYVGMYKLINLTKISQAASTYGATPNGKKSE